MDNENTVVKNFKTDFIFLNQPLVSLKGDILF